MKLHRGREIGERMPIWKTNRSKIELKEVKKEGHRHVGDYELPQQLVAEEPPQNELRQHAGKQQGQQQTKPQKE